jgi:hypothetical protein
MATMNLKKVIQKVIRKSLQEQIENNENIMKNIAPLIKNGEYKKTAETLVSHFDIKKVIDLFYDYFLIPWDEGPNVAKQFGITERECQKVISELISLKDERAAKSPDKKMFDFLTYMISYKIYEEDIPKIKYQVFIRGGNVSYIWIQTPDLETTIHKDYLKKGITFDKLLNFFNKYGAKKITRQKRVPRMTPYMD